MSHQNGARQDSFAVDPASPIPLFYQIAESIRGAIRSGALRPGDALIPLREAAERWGVNVHTVRHAYTSLAREGLVTLQRGAAGTRVAATTRGSGPSGPESADSFLDRVLLEARLHHRMDSGALAANLRKRAQSLPPRIHVVECSRWQAECHAREVMIAYRVDAIAWPMSDGEPPQGSVLSTYFHYNDVRRRWPRRLDGMRFISIRPDPTLRTRLAGHRSIVVCEFDPDTAMAAGADLSVLLDSDRPAIRTKCAPDPNTLVPPRRVGGPVHLFPPRAWAALSEHSRRHERVAELRYVLDAAELRAIAAHEGWERATTFNRKNDEAFSPRAISPDRPLVDTHSERPSAVAGRGHRGHGVEAAPPRPGRHRGSHRATIGRLGGRGRPPR